MATVSGSNKSVREPGGAGLGGVGGGAAAEGTEKKEKVKWVFGFLYKLGEHVKGWKLRVFLLKPDQKLRYYACDDDPKEREKLDVKTLEDPIGTIDCRGAKVFAIDRGIHQRTKDSYIFGLTALSSSRTYVLEAVSEKKRKMWMEVLEEMGAEIGEPLRMAPAFPNETRLECYMEKMGESPKVNGWKVRFITASSDSVMWYKSYESAQMGEVALGNVPIGPDSYLYDLPGNVLDRPYCFAISAQRGRGRKYLFSLCDAEEKEKWMARLKDRCPCPSTSIMHFFVKH